MSDEASLVPGTTLAETYRIVRRVGAGGMGEVYEATHTRLAGRYAIKVLHGSIASQPDVRARFEREAEITSKLRHPNIVSVLDFNVMSDGRPFLAMEFLEGVDLGDHMAAAGALPLSEVLEISGQVASALAVAHASGVVHRDLKPQNVFLVRVPVEEKQIVKVVDFGVSKVLEASLKLTLDTSMLGTPRYMSPEQALGKVANIDERTDQFALATMVYEMLTGQVAYEGDSVPSVLYQVVHEWPVRIGSLRPSIPKAVDDVIFRGFAKSRSERYPSVREFQRALTEAARFANAAAEVRPAIVGKPNHLGTPPDPRSTLLLPSERSAEVRGPSKEPSDDRVTSTLSSVAAERAGRTSRSRRWPLMAAGSLFIVGAVGLWLAPFTQEGPLAPPTPTSLAPLPTSSAKVEPLFVVNVERAPPGLTVKVDGQPAQLPLSLLRRDHTYALWFAAPDMESFVIPLHGLPAEQNVSLRDRRFSRRKGVKTTTPVQPDARGSTRAKPRNSPNKTVDPFAALAPASSVPTNAAAANAAPAVPPASSAAPATPVIKKRSKPLLEL